jgi:hypothetical protein
MLMVLLSDQMVAAMLTLKFSHQPNEVGGIQK